MTTEAPKKKRPMWQWIAGAIVLLLICGVVANMTGGDKDDKTASEPSGSSSTTAPANTTAPEKPAEPTTAPKMAAIGDAVTSGDLSWTVVAVEDKGQKWAGNYDSKTTAGRFLKVDLAITNNGKDQVSLFSQPTIKDSGGREFKASDDLMMVIGSDTSASSAT